MLSVRIFVLFFIHSLYLFIYLVVEWCESLYDWTDPAEQQILEKILPEAFERREAQLIEMADLQKRLGLMRLYGIRSKACSVCSVFLLLMSLCRRICFSCMPLLKRRSEFLKVPYKTGSSGTDRPGRTTLSEVCSTPSDSPTSPASQPGTSVWTATSSQGWVYLVAKSAVKVKVWHPMLGPEDVEDYWLSWVLLDNKTVISHSAPVIRTCLHP